MRLNIARLTIEIVAAVLLVACISATEGAAVCTQSGKERQKQRRRF